MIDVTFVETRSTLDKAIQSSNELRSASRASLVTVETLNEMETILFRSVVILYYEELQIKIKSIYEKHLKKVPIHDYFKERDNKNISYTDVLLFLLGVKLYDSVIQQHKDILDIIKSFKEMRNHFAHYKDTLGKQTLNKADWHFGRSEFKNATFLNDTESFLQDLIKLLQS